MKRPSRSFVVEVRRQRRPPGEPAPSWTEELQRPQSNGASGGADPPSWPVAEAAAAAPTRPTGRILPSLIETMTPAAAPVATKPPKAAKPTKPAKPAKPRVKRRRPQAPASQAVRVVAEPPPTIAAPPPVAERAAGSADPADRAARHRRILARYVFGKASKPGERWKRRLRGDKS